MKYPPIVLVLVSFLIDYKPLFLNTTLNMYIVFVSR